MMSKGIFLFMMGMCALILGVAGIEGTIGLAKGKLRNMPILATRGCPYQCTFCSSPSMWTTRYIMRDPKEIVDEIEWLIKKYEANDFEFFDLTAIIKKNWILFKCYSKSFTISVGLYHWRTFTLA